MSTAPQQDQFLAGFVESLTEQRGLDASERDTLLRLVEKALAQSPTMESATADGTSREAWLQTLELLSRHELLDDGQREALIRQFDEASQGEGTAVRWAVEFARRQRQDGDAAAQAWLQQQVAAEAVATGGHAAAPAGMSADVALAMRRRR